MRAPEPPDSPEEFTFPEWEELLAWAAEEVHRTVRRLPAHLRARAETLPVTYEPCPSEALVADGYDPDLLGLFVGSAFGEDFSGPLDLPPQIILFLDSLWDFADGEDAVFREELRRTYLHELGHYLGLDEVDLEARGLE